MVLYNKIDNISSDFLYIENLLQKSFPEAERRPIPKQRDLLKEKDFHCEIIKCNRQRAGFVNWWSFSNFNYCEHIAIDPLLRNIGIGSQVITKLLSYGPLLLEVEPPDNEVAERRIRLYQTRRKTLPFRAEI